MLDPITTTKGEDLDRHALRQRLEDHLVQLVQERDPYWSPLGHRAVRAYIQTQLAQWGNVTPYPLQRPDRSLKNLILDLPSQASDRSGTDQPLILVGAHFDAVAGSPGADDNASGVAVLLELARHLSHHPLRWPIRLVAFDLEEHGLVGSRVYAEDLKQQGQRLRLMISLEMLGYRDPKPGSQVYPAGLQRFYPDRGDFIALIGNLKTLPDLVRLSRQMRRSGTPCEWLPAGQKGKIVPDTRRSDHAPFWDQGYGAILITDTAQLRNPHYHRLSDRLETLDLDFLTGVCRGMIQGLRSL